MDEGDCNMALIACPECKTMVSEKAESCPKCAAPIAEKRHIEAAGTQVKTIEETSKKFKLHTLMSIGLFIAGLVVASKETGDASPLAGIMILVSIAWFITNKFRIWWHHK